MINKKTSNMTRNIIIIPTKIQQKNYNKKPYREMKFNLSSVWNRSCDPQHHSNQ